jgi:hypothetical protein
MALDRLNSRLFSRKLTNCRQSRFHKKNATVATSRQSIFRKFCCGFFIGFQWENGRIRTKWPQNKSSKISVRSQTVDYVADPRSCNSLLFSRKLTNCRLLKKKSRNSQFIVKSRLSTSRLARSPILLFNLVRHCVLPVVVIQVLYSFRSPILLFNLVRHCVLPVVVIQVLYLSRSPILLFNLVRHCVLPVAVIFSSPHGYSVAKGKYG